MLFTSDIDTIGKNLTNIRNPVKNNPNDPTNVKMSNIDGE
jgi:hypothetical protein